MFQLRKKPLQTSVKSTRYVTVDKTTGIFLSTSRKKVQRQIIIMRVKDETAFLSIVDMQVDIT